MEKMERLELSGKKIRVSVNGDFSLSVKDRDGRLIWESSRACAPGAMVHSGDKNSRAIGAGRVERQEETNV